MTAPGNVAQEVLVDENGDALFYCNGGSVSVWILKEKSVSLGATN